jgi:hypothetical protein
MKSPQSIPNRASRSNPYKSKNFKTPKFQHNPNINSLSYNGPVIFEEDEEYAYGKSLNATARNFHTASNTILEEDEHLSEAASE